jgi:hypothetical protein
MAGAFQVGPFQPAFQQVSSPPLPPPVERVVGAGSSRRRIQAEYKGEVYDFDTAAEARDFLLSLPVEIVEPVKKNRKKKQGAIATPPVHFTIDDVPLERLNLQGWKPLDAVMANRFDLLYEAVQRVLEDEEETVFLLM